MFELINSGQVSSGAAAWYFFTHGGFLIVLWAFLYIGYQMYREETITQFVLGQEWVFLSIRAPRENLDSLLKTEQFFTQIHAVHSGYTFAETYMEGKIQLWYSMEIVSFGGKISFIARVPKKTVELFEAALYAQYPTAEISKVDDYLENLNYTPGESDFEIWGTEFKQTADEAFPIRTYKEFEHSSAEEKIIDPLGAVFEGLSKMKPWEVYGIQILIQPLGDPEWKGSSEKKAKELLGEKSAPTTSWTQILLAPIFWLSGVSLVPKPPQAPPAEKKEKNYMSMTEVEKEQVSGIQRKATKPGYKTKIRHIYIAPKDKFDGGKKMVMIGSYRPFGSAALNQFKPDTGYTWTDPKYMFSQALESTFLQKESAKRKAFLFKAYKNRSMGIGASKFILNVEELATIYHLPLQVSTQIPDVQKLESKKAQPPSNLPVGNYE